MTDVFHIRIFQSFCIVNNTDTRPCYTSFCICPLNLLGWIFRRVNCQGSNGIKNFNFATYLAKFLPLYFSWSLNISLTKHQDYNSPSFHVCKRVRKKTFASVISSQTWLSLTTLFSFFFSWNCLWKIFSVILGNIPISRMLFYFKKTLGWLDCCWWGYHPRKRKRSNSRCSFFHLILQIL